MTTEYSLVIVTFILAGITAWYAVETRRMVGRMDREREEMHRPVLTFQLVPWQGNSLKLRIQNVGLGAAFGVNGKIEAETKSGITAIPWSYSVLAAGKYEEFGVPVSENRREFDFNAIRLTVNKVVAKFTYKSIAGVEYRLEDSIDVQKLATDWVVSQMLVTQDHPDRIMPRIAKAIEDLKKRE